LDIKITKSNGDIFTLEGLGVAVKDFIVSSPGIESSYEKIEGRHGFLNTGATYGSRTIVVPFYFDAELRDFAAKRDLLFSLLSDVNPFFIEELRREEADSYAFVDTNEKPKKKDGTENALVSGKRYLVRPVNGLEFEQSLRVGEGELQLETVGVPFAESVNVVKRKFSESNFGFANQGNISISMKEQQETTISFKGVSSGLTIRNVSTGEEWAYNGTTTASDEIKLVGVRSLKNNQSIFSQTNRKLISFATGNNKIEIEGATGDFEIVISTRFYFL